MGGDYGMSYLDVGQACLPGAQARLGGELCPGLIAGDAAVATLEVAAWCRPQVQDHGGHLSVLL